MEMQGPNKTKKLRALRVDRFTGSPDTDWANIYDPVPIQLNRSTMARTTSRQVFSLKSKKFYLIFEVDGTTFFDEEFSCF